MFESLGKLVLYLMGDATSYNKTLRDAAQHFRGTTQIIKTQAGMASKSIDNMFRNASVNKQFAQMRSTAQIHMASIAKTIQQTPLRIPMSEIVGHWADMFAGISREAYIAGSIISNSLSRPLQDFIVATVKASMQFQRSMAVILGLSNATKRNIREWSKELLEMGPKFAKDPLELAEALYFVSSAGLKGKQIMEVLTTSTMAAAAGLGNVKEVAFSVTSALNAYSKSGYSAVNVTDMIIAAARAGQMEAADLSRIIGSALPLASAMQVPLNDLLASIAALTRQGASPAQSMIAIQGIMKNLQKPTVAAKKALAAVGLSFEQLRDLIKKPGGIIEALVLLHQALDKEGDDYGGIAEIFGEIRPLRGALGLLTQDMDSVREVFDEVANAGGNTQRAFEIMSKTPGFKFDQMLVQMKVLLIDVGDAITEMVTPAFEQIKIGLKEVKKWWDSLDPSIKKFIGYALMIGAVLGPIILAFGSFSMIASLVAGAVASFMALSAILVPLIPLILGIGIAALVAIKHMDKIKGIWDEAVKEVMGFWEEVKPIWDALVDLAKAVWEKIEYYAKNSIGSMIFVLKSWYDNAKMIFMGLSQLVLEMLQKISGNSKLTWGQIIESIEYMIYTIEFAVRYWRDFWDVAVAAGAFAYVSLREETKHYFDYAKQLTEWFLANWTTVFQNVYMLGIKIFGDLFNRIGQVDILKLLSGEQKLGDLFEGAWDTIKKDVEGVIKDIPKFTERAITEEERRLAANLKTKSKKLYDDYINFLASKKVKGIPGAEEEIAEAGKQGRKVAAEYKNALKREFNTIDAALMFSAEGFKRVREYFAMLNGETKGKGPGNKLNFNPKGPRPNDNKPILNFDVRDRRVAGWKTPEERQIELLTQMRDAIVMGNKMKEKNGLDVLPLDLGNLS